MGKTVLVLGGGLGGVVAANRLRKKLGAEHSVILVDKQKEHLFQPSLLWVMLGLRKPSQILRDFRILQRKGIKYINSEVLGIDISQKRVHLGKEDLSYDYLIVSLGAELNLETIPGFKETAFNLYSLEGASRLTSALKDFSEGKVAVSIPRIPFKCPAAPYEAAFLLDYLCRQKKIRNKIEISIYTAEPQPFPVAGRKVGERVEEMLQKQEISYSPNQKLTSVDSQKKELIFENGKKAPFDLHIGIFPHQAPSVVKEAGLTGEADWIPVDRSTLKTESENVYALGDVTAVRLPGAYKPGVPLMLPKAGVFAHQEAEVVAENIAAEIGGGAAKKKFLGEGSCFLEIGYGQAGYAKGNFYATPHPLVEMRPPGKRWRWGKIILEKYWFWHWF